MTAEDYNPLGWPVEPLYVSQEQFARMHQIIADAGYGNEELAGSNIRREFGLKIYTMYEVKVIR